MTVEIRNAEQLLSKSDVQKIEVASARWGFDAVVVVKSFPSKSELERGTRAALRPNRTLAIGVDPAHNLSSMRISNDLRVPSSVLSELSTASSSAIRAHAWADAIIAIGDRAQLAEERSDVLPAAPAASTRPEPVEAGAKAAAETRGVPESGAARQGRAVEMSGVLAAIALVLLVVYWGWRRRRERAAALRDAEHRRLRDRDEAAWRERFNADTGIKAPGSRDLSQS